MIGVVLWSDLCSGKAVFWCEDQGDLAYFEDPLKGAGIDSCFFDAGDMVQFDVTVQRNFRTASNARLLQEQAWSGLPDTLRSSSANEKAAPAARPRSAKIIPFLDDAKSSRTAIAQTKRKA